ncbi:MAG: rubredoxin [Mycobacterium sp.]
MTESYRGPSCSVICEEAKGNAREGFPAAMPWTRVPDDWRCSDCGVREQVDFGEAVSA